MQTKNVAIHFQGGCGGHFIYYFLLASGIYSASYKFRGITINIKPGSVRKIRQQFYMQFDTKNDWISRELWPDNTDIDDNPRLLLYCDSPPEKPSSTISICPYMTSFDDWWRTILYKKTQHFRYKTPTLSLVKELYRERKSRKKTFSTKVADCDYYFEITQFVNNLEHRKALCEFLTIPHTDLMEEFVAHYNECHKPLKYKTSW